MKDNDTLNLLDLTYFIGMDLHSNNISVCVIQNSINPKTKKLGYKVIARKSIIIDATLNDLKEFLGQFCSGKKHIATVESTYNWYHVADMFEDLGWNINLADPTTVKENKIKATDDRVDAEFLADRLRLGTLRFAKILPKKERALRDLVRTRGVVITDRARYRTILKNMINNQLNINVSTTYLEHLYKCTLGDSELKKLMELFNNKMISLKVENYLRLANACTEQINYLEKKIREIQINKNRDDEYNVNCNKYLKRLCSIKGCGFALSTSIAVEIADINRFKTAGDFVSYCRLAPTLRLSNLKVKGEGNRKNGNAYLSWSMTELANLVVMFNPEIKRCYQMYYNKSKLRVKAIRTIAAKLARAIWYMLKNDEDFNVKLTFYK